MANLIANSSTSTWSGNWATVETASLKTDGASSVNVTTGNLDSTAFIPAAVALDGVALNISSRAASPTGTFTVILRNSTTSTNIQTVTINVSDLPVGTYTAGVGGSWAFFKFGATHTPNGTDSYVIRVTTSSSTQVGLYATTANNWNRMLRRTTTATIAASDASFILGEYTGAGTKNSISVTMDNNNTTAFGAMSIGYSGSLTWTTSATTNLRVAGNLSVYQGGGYYQGNDATPIGASYISKLEFDNVSAGQYGLYFYNADCTIEGASKTKSWSLLNADASAGATSLTIADSVGSAWKNGDTLVITSTTRTIAETETKTMTADGSGTTLAVNALTYAHGGNSTTKVQGEVGNLTRNVKITTVTAANSTFIYFDTLATGYIKWVEIYNIGSTTTAKRGIEIATTSGTGVTIANCSIYMSAGISNQYGTIISGSGTVTIDNNVIYNFTGSGTSIGALGSGTSLIITNNLCTATSGGITVSNSAIGSTIKGNYISSNSSSGGLQLGSSGASTIAITAIENNVIHTCSVAINCYTIGLFGILNNNSCWRNTGNAIAVGASSGKTLTISNGYIFGNSSSGVAIGGSQSGLTILDGITIDGGTTLTQPIGISLNYFTSSYFGSSPVKIYNCNLGVNQTHSGSDISVNGSNLFTTGSVQTFNTVFNSSTKIANQSFIGTINYISNSKYGGTNNKYLTWYNSGTVESDTTSLGFTSTVSEKMTPISASIKLKSASKFVALNNGQTATVTVKARKGTGYNGVDERLIVGRNAYGVTADTVLATGTSAIGTIDTLSSTTVAATGNGVFEFWVDCDGTAGFINVTDWSVTVS